MLVVRNPPVNSGDIRDSGSGRSPGGGHGNPLQHSCLENPMDRGAWKAAVHGVSKERDRTQQLTSSSILPITGVGIRYIIET